MQRNVSAGVFKQLLRFSFFVYIFSGRSAVKEEESTAKTEARSKLNKALENAEEEIEKEQEQQEEEESEPESEKGTEEEEEEEKVPVKKTKIKIEKDDAPAVKEAKPPRVPKQPQLPSYIMKLFDRSVNLAKFEESTPLYPLCRSWMQNQPRALPMKQEKNRRSSHLHSRRRGCRGDAEGSNS